MPKILIVEDEEKLTGYLKSLLENRGHSVVTAVSGKEALDSYISHNPDAVLLDLYLPGDVNGYDVLSCIKSKAPGVKVAVITGYSESSVRERANSLGADIFFKKPFMPHELFDALEQILNKAGGGTNNE